MFNVTLRRLKVFLAVSETGSFTRAADELDIAQPSVSAHIISLEREVGGSVFERRRGSKPVLTDLGRSVRKHALEMIASADDMRADVVNINNAAGQKLVLSCQRSLANFVLKEPLTHFILTRTDIQLVVRIGTQEDVLEEVREGISDIGCFLSNEDMRRLNNQIIGAQRLRLVCAPDHPLAGRKNVRPAEVAKHGFVGPPPGSMFGKSVTRLLSDIGIQDMRVVAQATEYQFLRELVAGGVGISCSPEKSVEADIRSGRLNFIDVKAPDLLFDIRLISLQNRAMSGPMQELSEYLRHNMPTL